MTCCAVSTVIVKLQLAVLFEVSVAVQVTVVTPTGKTEPEVTTTLFWFLQTTLWMAQLSLAVGAKVAFAPLGQVGSSVWLAGQVIAGGCVSLTVTVNEQVLVLFEASRAVHVTVVVPFGNAVPDAGLQLTVAPGQLSLTVGVV
jgi:hypothetical protein